MGDSHDPNDPHFARFKQSILTRYGVKRVEDLPVNYKGLLGMEGERLTSALFDRYAGKSNATQHSQNALVRSFGLLSPTISLRALSMAAAGTDFAAHQRFLEQAEAYRYALVQRLNRLQAEGVDYHDDTAQDADADRRKRVDASHWEAMPDFRFEGADASTLTQAALPGLMMILGWLAAATGLLIFSTRRLGDAR